mgnify:CR=1 FL=1
MEEGTTSLQEGHREPSGNKDGGLLQEVEEGAGREKVPAQEEGRLCAGQLVGQFGAHGAGQQGARGAHGLEAIRAERLHRPRP